MARRATRQPKTLFPGQRRFRLKLACILEVARLRARAAKAAPQPDPDAPAPLDDEPATVAIPYETMASVVERRAA